MFKNKLKIIRILSLEIYGIQYLLISNYNLLQKKVCSLKQDIQNTFNNIKQKQYIRGVQSMKVQKHVPVVSASGLKVLDLLTSTSSLPQELHLLEKNGTNAQPTLNPQSEAEFKAARKQEN